MLKSQVALLSGKGLPLYSMPHFSFAITGLPVRSLRNGFGFTGICGRQAAGRSGWEY